MLLDLAAPPAEAAAALARVAEQLAHGREVRFVKVAARVDLPRGLEGGVVAVQY